MPLPERHRNALQKGYGRYEKVSVGGRGIWKRRDIKRVAKPARKVGMGWKEKVPSTYPGEPTLPPDRAR